MYPNNTTNENAEDHRDILYGYCKCGCGQQTKISPQSSTFYKHINGAPRDYLQGHWTRTRHRHPLAERYWEKVDRNGPIHPILQTACWLWLGGTSTTGYARIFSGTDSVPNMQAHRVSWELHYGPIPDKMHCLHKCDNPPCTNPEHLFLGTPADNSTDKLIKGRQPRGEKNGKSILNDGDIREIRKLSAAGVSQKDIARQFHTDQTNISYIVRRKTWAHVK